MSNGNTESFNTILNKLLIDRDDISSEELAEIKKQAQALSRNSSRHHYIPQFYLKGFTGSDNLFSVYDKTRDEIKRVRTGTNGVFYEKNRNTLYADGLTTSLIEDCLFAKIDTDFSKVIKKLREQPNDGTLLDSDTIGMMSGLLIDLFWRNPASDIIFDRLLAAAKITFTDNKTGISFRDVEKEAQFKSDPLHRKMERSRMTLEAINSILSERRPGSAFSKLWEFEDELFVVGDLPALYERTPQNHADLLTLNYFIPISSRRLYASQSESGLNFKVTDAYLFNALIISQSQTMVCCASNDTLSASIKIYKELKSRKNIEEFKSLLFKRT